MLLWSGPIYTPVNPGTDMMSFLGLDPVGPYWANWSFFPINSFGVIMYVLPIFVLPPSQSCIQSNIVDSRTTVYENDTCVIYPSSVVIDNGTEPCNVLFGIEVIFNKYVVLFVLVKDIPICSLPDNREVQLKGIILSPLNTVMYVHALSS